MQMLPESLLLFAGNSKAEAEEAQEAERLAALPGRLRIVPAGGLRSLVVAVASLRGLISNDTFVMHLAHALGIPTVGLFSTTRRQVWGPPDSASYTGILSRACQGCPVLPVQGTCEFMSGVCPCVPREAFSPEAIASALMRLI
jgi:ADP-heptose:LPS heptosyltransferase